MGKTLAHAGVAGLQGAIIGLTNGGSLILNAGLSGGSSIIDDDIDGKLETKKDLEVSLAKAGTKAVISYVLGSVFSRYDHAIEAVGEQSKPLMYILQSKGMILNGFIDWGGDNILDRLYSGWDDVKIYDDPNSSEGKGYNRIHHEGLIK